MHTYMIYIYIYVHIDMQQIHKLYTYIYIGYIYIHAYTQGIYIIENDEQEIEYVEDPNQNSEEDDFVNIDEDEEDDQ